MASHYITDKQIAFQEAEKAFIQAQDAIENIDPTRADFGHNVKRAQKEAIEAEAQITKALSYASETQRERLEQYREGLEILKQQIEISNELR